MAALDKKELWVQWTHDAVSQYAIPEEVEDSDELIDDMVDVATKYADQMLDEYEARFDGGGGGGRGRNRKRTSKDDDS
jgi:hypothetical protein